MSGELLGVWPETWREIWLPGIDHDDAPNDSRLFDCMFGGSP